MNNTALSHWLIGTAQFGMQYGVTNQSGVPDDTVLTQLLKHAEQHGCVGFDTAPGYGNSQQRLAQYTSLKHAYVCTKVSAMSDRSIAEQVAESLSQLGLNQVDSVLIHDVYQLNNDRAINETFKQLDNVKEQGLARSIGVSLYNVAQSKKIREMVDLDVVQIPLNLWNQEFIESGELQQLKQSGITVQARSLFLQGILLTNKLPTDMTFMQPEFDRWQQTLAQRAISPAEACFSFALDQADIDHWVIGFLHLEQLQEFFSSAYKHGDWQAFSVNDPNIVNPALW